MTKYRNGRYAKKSEAAIDPYTNLAISIIVDAINIATGKSTANDKGPSQSGALASGRNLPAVGRDGWG